MVESDLGPLQSKAEFVLDGLIGPENHQPEIGERADAFVDLEGQSFTINGSGFAA